jgi:hypothetical protein
MQFTLPTVLIALGGLALITQRNGWLVLGGLLVQWVGFAWQISSLPAGSSVALLEVVTAAACGAIMALSIRNTPRASSATGAARITTGPRAGARQAAFVDQLWLWAIALVAGLAGFGLARLYPLGGSEQDLIAFYWMLLPAVLALVIDGSRDPVKLGASLIALFNTSLSLVYPLSATSPSVSLLGLAALCRVVLAALSGYSWHLLKMSHRELDLNWLFDMRDGKVETVTALMIADTFVPAGPEATELEPAMQEIESQGDEGDEVDADVVDAEEADEDGC